MIKHFKWRLLFDGNELPVKVSSSIQCKETEINYLNAKSWIPGKDKSGQMKVTLFEPHDLWQGSRDVQLLLQDMFGKDLEYWTLKDATAGPISAILVQDFHLRQSVISYKDVAYKVVEKS